MKTPFDDRLKQLDGDIQWNEQRKYKVKQELEAEMGKLESKSPMMKPVFVYTSSLVAFVLLLVVGFNMLTMSDQQTPSDEGNIPPVVEEDVVEEDNYIDEKEEEIDSEDDVKMTEDRSTWTEEEMENDISAGITLTHRQLTKYVDGEWTPEYRTDEDQQIMMELFSTISQASTAAFHTGADNYLYVDLMNVNEVLGEAFRTEDEEGLRLAYQVLHDLDVAYNGYEPDLGPFEVTLYRDATYDVVRAYLGRE
ncbi:hypothetical protein [Halalkalibacter wakoensis]|uniref:hypothetical protein n=1 Tax=Halalkalibacter wakoensis TaxID=127891 RepID=UPI000556010B|nr:hypothetical protein [Halalkalibacter wakoensis]